MRTRQARGDRPFTHPYRPHAYVVVSVNGRGPFQTHRFRPPLPPLAVATFSLRAGLLSLSPTTRGAPRPANLSSSPPPPLVLRRLMTIYIESRLHNHHGPSIDDESHESRLVRACVRTQPRDTDRRRRPQLLLLLLRPPLNRTYTSSLHGGHAHGKRDPALRRRVRRAQPVRPDDRRARDDAAAAVPEASRRPGDDGRAAHAAADHLLRREGGGAGRLPGRQGGRADPPRRLGGGRAGPAAAAAGGAGAGGHAHRPEGLAAALPRQAQGPVVLRQLYGL
uniref:Uncharacterized protein n=1 Tax=Zea mays TaxID=4577 RepID=A0A804UKH4_MAIZE